MNIPSRILPSPDDIKVVAVEVLSSKPFRICVLYNPPNSRPDYQHRLVSFVSTLPQEDGPVVIMGDFNTPDVNWSTLSANSEFSSKLCDLIFEHNLTHLLNILLMFKVTYWIL